MLIAEIGSVHDGSFGNALKLIELAAKCGADAVKFQTHIGRAESLKSAPNPGYFQDESRIEYFDRTSFTLEQWHKLKEISKEFGLKFISSPFSIEAVDMLEDVGLDYYKIPSGEVTNTPLLEHVLKTGKPIILSSGMSSWKELDEAYYHLKSANDLTIMQCTSEYPCKVENVGLNVITELKQRYNRNVGFSDHTLGFAAPIAAAALGASMIEKHFTFSRHMYGSDAKNSMEPEDFRVLSRSLKDTWLMIENPVDKSSNHKFSEMKKIFEKSIVAGANLKKGKRIEFKDLKFKKPGTGIPAADYKFLLGKTLLEDLQEDDFFNLKMIK